MRRFSWALAALATMVMGAASAAQAQDKPAKPDMSINKDQHDKGVKESAPVVAAAGIPCTVTDGYFLGAGSQKNAAGKDYKANIFEVACKEGMGYVVIAGDKGEKAKSFDCLATQSNPSLICRLPANQDPKKNLEPLFASAGSPCTVTAAKYVGSSPSSGMTYYEAACQQGDGYILQTGGGAAPKVNACLEVMDSNLACTLTTKAQSVASVSRLAAASGKPCQVSNARYVGASTQSGGERFYEVACGEQGGYMILTDRIGVFKQAINCANAEGIAGGCTLTDTTKAATAEAKTYTGLAKAGGFNCDVAKYRFIGMVEKPNKGEVVELACSNRPDGTVAVFPENDKLRAEFVDCVRAGQFGSHAACELTSNFSPLYAKYTAALAAKGRSSCKVSGAHYLGSSPEGTDYIETACADGGPGWVIELTKADQAKTLLNCAQAGASGLKCTLPTNTKG